MWGEPPLVPPEDVEAGRRPVDRGEVLRLLDDLENATHLIPGAQPRERAGAVTVIRHYITLIRAEIA